MKKVVWMALVGLACVPMTAFCQADSYRAVLQPTQVATKLPTDTVCPYFLLTNLGYLPTRVVAYQYIDSSGAQESDVIRAGKGRVVISDKAPVPNVVKFVDAERDATWTVFLSAAAYEANKACLGGLPRTQ